MRTRLDALVPTTKYSRKKIFTLTESIFPTKKQLRSVTYLKIGSSVNSLAATQRGSAEDSFQKNLHGEENENEVGTVMQWYILGRRDSLITVVIGLSTNRRCVIGASRIGHARGDSHSEIPNECLKENPGILYIISFTYIYRLIHTCQSFLKAGGEFR